MKARSPLTPLWLAPLIALSISSALLAQGLVFPQGPAGTQSRPVRWELSVAPTRVAPGGEIVVKAAYDIAAPWYIYAPDHDPEKGPGLPMQLSVESEQLSAVGTPVFPEPTIKKEAILNAVYRILKGKGSIAQRYRVDPGMPPGALSLTVQLEGQRCDPSVCVPESFTGEVEVTVTDEPPVAAADPTPTTGDLGGQSLWLFVLAMIGGGLFALAMPCTYPMIPITISYFTKQAEVRQGGVLPLALAYGAGIILVFNLIGVAFARSIQAFAFDWATNLFFCIAFVVFALSLFGLYSIRLPASVNAIAGRVSGVGGYIGVFLLGTVLVVSSFTCTAPVMGGLLILAVDDASGSADLGRVSLGMTVFGATMAVPFVLLSLFPARARTLPKAGEWMHVLKVSLGFLELAAAIKFFSNVDLALQWNILPRELFLVLWAGIFFVGGLYLLNIFRLEGESGAPIGPKRMLVGLSTILAALYFFWGALGYQLDWISNALAPAYSAERTAGASGAGKTKEQWTLVKDDIDRGVELARAAGKPLLVNFTGHV